MGHIRGFEYYETFEKEVTVGPGAIVPVSINLRPKLGGLIIDSYPDSAHVILNADTLGRTPFLSSQIPYGRHILSIDLPDYDSFDSTFIINSDQPLLKVAKRLKRSIAALTLAVLPGNVDIYIDGRYVQASVIRDYPLNYGQHSVEVTRPGYYGYNRTFVINRSDPLNLNIDLQPKSKTLAVMFSVALPGMGQYYSGYTLKGIMMSASFIACAAGSYFFNTLYTDERNKFLDSQSVYENTIDVNKMPEAYAQMIDSYDQMKHTYDLTRIFAAAAGAVWFYSLIDNILFFPSQNERGCSMSTSMERTKISLQYKF